MYIFFLLSLTKVLYALHGIAYTYEDRIIDTYVHGQIYAMILLHPLSVYKKHHDFLEINEQRKRASYKTSASA